MIATPEPTSAPPAPFGTNLEEADTGGFLSAMMKGLTPTSDKQEDAAPAAAKTPSPAAPAPSKPAEVDDMPPEIKSDKAKEGWKEVKRNLAETRKQADDYKAKLADLEKQLAERTTPVVPPDLQARLAALEQEREELSDRLRVADVERHPKFQEYFNGKTTALTEAAKAILGAEHAPKLDRILKVTDEEQRTALLDELMGDLTPARSARLGAVLADLEMLQRERSAEIGKSKERWTQLQQQSQAEREADVRGKEVLADRLVAAATEMEAFKTGDGADAARMAEVQTYKTFVKQALTGRLEGQDAQFMPLMAVEGLHLRTKVLPGLQAQVADLTARLARYESAQPRPGGGAGSDAGGAAPKSFMDVMSGRA
jgi:hypothetical protein